MISIFLKSGVRNELKKSFSLKEQKSQGYLFTTGQNVAPRKMLVWSACVWRITTDTLKKT